MHLYGGAYDRVVAFLQNAWSREYAGQLWPRDSWLEALHKSRSGQRLRNLAGLDNYPTR